MKAVLHYLGETKVEATSAHTYGNFSELKWMVEMMHQEFSRPVWVTEFADWNAKDAAAERDYLIQSVDLMERLDYVDGYAWFKERVDGNQKLSLLASSGKLTPLGEIYVKMPVHDPAVFYRLPGRLQAESYLAMNNAKIAETTDGEGFLELQSLGKGDWIDYQVAPEKAGTYEVQTPCLHQIRRHDRVFGGRKSAGAGPGGHHRLQTLTAQVQLPSGPQKIRVHCSEATRWNWMEFEGR